MLRQKTALVRAITAIFLMVNIVFPVASPVVYGAFKGSSVLTRLAGVAHATTYTGGTCAARSKGFYKNNDGCQQGEGESIWASDIRGLSSQYFGGAYSSIGGNQICSELDAVCGGGDLPSALCKLNQFLITDEANVVSGRLQLNALLAGADNGSQAFDALGLSFDSTIQEALVKLESVFVDGAHTQTQLQNAAEVAERMYTFYEDGNPHAPQCVFKTGPSCGNGVKEGTEQCDGTDGVGAHQRCTAQCILENLTYCGDGTVQNPDGEGRAEQCDDGNTIDGDGCSKSCHIKPFCRMELIKTDNPDPVSPGAPLTYTLRLTNTGTGYCTGGGVLLKEYYDAHTQYVSAYPAPTTGNNLWNFGSVPPGEIHEVTVSMRVSDSAVNGDVLNNRACFWTKEYNTWICVDEPTHVVAPSCGNGIKEGSEQCDGTNGVGAHQRCTAQCILENLTYCGDGIVQNPNGENGAEQCDGTAGLGEHQACSAQCTLVSLDFCGDTIKNADEQCDGTDGVGAHQRCTAQCTLENLTYCGDGIVQNPNAEDVAEQCDGTDGVPSGFTCDAECSLHEIIVTTSNICGVKFNDKNQDGIQDEGEENLSGWTVQLYKKTQSSTIVHTILHSLGGLIGPSDPESDIQQGGMVFAQNNECWEQENHQWHYICGSGGGGNPYTLTATAITTDQGYCFNDLPAGDYFIAEVGQNDWGVISGSCSLLVNGHSDYQCKLANYQLPVVGPQCGNGIKEDTEQCDDGNTTSGDGCSSQCTTEGTGGTNPSCGDGVKNQDSEQCDGTDGVGVHQRCTAQCILENLTYCGDGTVQNPNSGSVAEQCDDGNTSNGDGCTNQCTVETPPQTSNPPSGGRGSSGGGGGGGGFITQLPRISIDKTVDRTPVEAGDTVTYTVVITNTGNTVAFDPKLTDTLPFGFTFVDGDGGVKTWELPPLSVGARSTTTYAVHVSDTTTRGLYANRAVASIRNGQSVEDTVTVQVFKPIVLSIEAPQEKPKVKGISTLPDTGGFDTGLWLMILTSLFLSTSLSSFFYVYRQSHANAHQ